MLDVNLRPGADRTQALRFGIDHATIIKCNEDEIAVVCDIAGADTPAELLQLLPKCETIAVTHGPSGAVIHTCRTPATGVKIKAPAVPSHQIVDMVGAGDAFCAALAAGVLRGADLALAARVACATGAEAIKFRGATGAETLKGMSHTLDGHTLLSLNPVSLLSRGYYHVHKSDTAGTMTTASHATITTSFTILQVT